MDLWTRFRHRKILRTARVVVELVAPTGAEVRNTLLANKKGHQPGHNPGSLTLWKKIEEKRRERGYDVMVVRNDAGKVVKKMIIPQSPFSCN